MKPGLGITIAILGAAALTALVVSLVQGIPSPEDPYRPSVAAGEVVYLEACAKCHGASGEGTALAPGLRGRKLRLDWVEAKVLDGTGRMPRFPNIQGDALKNLTNHINKM